MDLHPGEDVIFEGHPSWRSTLGFYLKGIALALLAAAIAAVVTRILDDEVNWGIVIAAFLVVEGLAMAIGFVKRMTTVYTITSQRLRIQKGLVSRKVQQTQIERVQNVNTSQSALQRLLRVGTVDFDTAGTDDSNFVFTGVSEPAEVVAAVDRAQRVNEAQDDRGTPGGL